MKRSFNDLNISPLILKSLEEMGFESPTTVQGKVIPHILKKEDLIVISKTGSGKTAAFGVPMLQLTVAGVGGPQGLILTPTRELAVQVDSDIKNISKHLPHKAVAVYGQHSLNIEIQELKKNPAIVTGTPGRVFDHIRQGNLVTKNVRFLVLDEADRMLDMGFIDQVLQIIKKLPTDRVTLLFSATIPAEIQNICKKYMRDPVTIEIESQTKTVDTIEQLYYRVDKNEKRTQLNRILLVEQPESCMIFCNTRFAVDRVHDFLFRKGYSAQPLHGDVPQGKRLKTIQQFKNGEFHLLVATDVAARGIHVDDLKLVINYDVPNEKNNYVHRIGRTGRAGSVGRAITLASSEDIMSLYEIEEYIGAMIPEEELPSAAVLNEQKANSEKWIQSKPQINSERKPERSRSRNPELSVGRNRNPERNSSLTTPKPYDKNRERRPYAATGVHSEVNSEVNSIKKQVRIPLKPIRSYSTRSDVGSDTGSATGSDTINAKKITKKINEMGIVKAIVKEKKAEDSATKKSFIKRLLKGVLGK